MRTLKCAEEFRKRGHDVTLIAPTDGVCEVNGIPVHWLHAPRKQRSQILSSLKFNVRLLRKFLQRAKTTDLFFVHNTVAAATIPFLRRFYRFRFVLDVTDIHAEYLAAARRNLFEKLLTPLILAIEYWIIGNADRVIVVTRAMKDLLVRNGIDAARIEVIYDAAELDKIEPGKDPGSENAVIHLGSVDRQHGVELFIAAVPLVAAACPDARFFIVGGGRELPNVIGLAEELGVRGLCVFTDTLPCDEARQYMRKAVVGVIPRQDELPNRIVTTLKIYEYWAGETAVVASRLPGISEIAEDGRDILFFQAGSAADMAGKIIRLLGNRDLAESLARQGAITVRKYTWSSTVPKIADFALNPGKDSYR